jgi:hypothetical protein
MFCIAAHCVSIPHRVHYSTRLATSDVDDLQGATSNSPKRVSTLLSNHIIIFDSN